VQGERSDQYFPVEGNKRPSLLAEGDPPESRKKKKIKNTEKKWRKKDLPFFKKREARSY